MHRRKVPTAPRRSSSRVTAWTRTGPSADRFRRYPQLQQMYWPHRPLSVHSHVRPWTKQSSPTTAPAQALELKQPGQFPHAVGGRKGGTGSGSWEMVRQEKCAAAVPTVESRHTPPSGLALSPARAVVTVAPTTKRSPRSNRIIVLRIVFLPVKRVLAGVPARVEQGSLVY